MVPSAVAALGITVSLSSYHRVTVADRARSVCFGPLAGRPYRRLGMSPPPAPTPRSRPAVQVEKRSLRDYAAVAR